MEAIALFAALGLMLGAVVFKVYSAGLINRMKMGIAGVEQEKQGFLNQLKASQAQHQVATKNQKTQERKLTKLKKTGGRLKGELAEFQAGKEKQARQQEVLRQNLSGSPDTGQA